MKSKIFTIAILAIIATLTTLTTDVEARGRFSRRSGGGSSVGVGNLAYDINPSLQVIAQARAEAMASSGTLSHSIHNFTSAPHWSHPGCSGEGIGCASGSPDYKTVATCIVGSTVVADGHAISASGTTYRVRLFR